MINLLVIVVNQKKDSINVIKYKLQNTTSNILYVNNITDNKLFLANSVYESGRSLRIFNKSGKEIEYFTIVPQEINIQDRDEKLNCYRNKTNKMILIQNVYNILI